MTKYFPKSKSLVGGNVKFELGLCNCARKYDLKNATDVNTSNCAKKVHLATLISIIGKVGFFG